MATNILNPQPLDHLGRPCKLSEVIDMHERPILAGRAMQPQERRRQIGILLADYIKAAEAERAALELAHEALYRVADAEQPEAVVGMVLRSQAQSSVKLFEAVGYMLAALETQRADLKEVGHA
jgi:hypothetical protein